jgi:6,7-dimethyl-8-ribityllumazine synthase
MKQAQNEKECSLAVVVSRFNEEVTSLLQEGALARLAELGVPEKNIKVIQVPGAVEIPLTAKLLAQSKRYQAIICLGAVIRGETSHYDYVCSQVSEGCQQVMLNYDIPVIFGVLTTENEEQALSRAGGAGGHKGRDAADAALTMIKVVQSI